ncbi:MAG: toll/interleukin-1 receptor domain-containing protein [Anaerolineae bacterium]|nr:toll/interleukin-1 receptor domain-containing protein [Anaerolineae bacterium]
MNFDDSPDDSPEPVEAYCVHCRETVEMEDPVAVWTRRGVPATRGDCPICGGTVFRMGKSSVHERTGEPDVRPRVKLARQTVYVDFAPADAVTAERLAADLERIGVNCWLHEHEAAGFNWAGGVHPALSGCDRMIYVLSGAALEDPLVEQAWRYFREKRKPIIVAQLDDSAPPDDLRRRPRFDLSQQYKAAFRQLLQSLNDGR